jgi:DMSO/TMAO reductase YedYZ molybdopterin-dependent catalytic subunit
MMRVTAFVALATLLSLSPADALDPEPTIAVAGALPRTGAIGLKDLQALGATTVEWVDHGEKHRVTGVRLDKVLAAFGFRPGPRGKEVPIAEKRAGYRKVLVAVGSDGYQVAFSCAEVSPEIGATQALVAWCVDGEPLRAGSGPLRLVVVTDREGARSVRALERLVVVDATQPSVKLPP